MFTYDLNKQLFSSLLQGSGGTVPFSILFDFLYCNPPPPPIQSEGFVGVRISNTFNTFMLHEKGTAISHPQHPEKGTSISHPQHPEKGTAISHPQHPEKGTAISHPQHPERFIQ